jgi:hypothetical protein
MTSEDEKPADDLKVDLPDFEIEDFTKPESNVVHPAQPYEKRDEALDLLASNGQNITYVTAQEDARILRKIDRKYVSHSRQQSHHLILAPQHYAHNVCYLSFATYVFLSSNSYLPSLIDCLVMDKQTISLSSVFGLARETNLVGDDYSLLGSIL